MSPRIIRYLGAGTQGVVFEALDRRLDRRVALKLWYCPSGETLHAQVVTEAQRLARIRHENVVSVFGADVVGDTVGFWMELVEGPTLEQQLNDVGALLSERALSVALQVSAALSAIHRAGLLHRDVKTQNVLVQADGTTRLTDFGAVSALEPTQRATLKGSPLYLAPEVLRGEPASIQSDIYSFGVLLYRVLTGRFPIEATSFDQLLEAHRVMKSGPDWSQAGQVDPGSVSIVNRCLQSDPARRYATMDDVRRALEGVRGVNGSSSRLIRGALLAALITGLGAVGDRWPLPKPSIDTGRSIRFVPAWLRSAQPFALARDQGWILCGLEDGSLARCEFTPRAAEPARIGGIAPVLNGVGPRWTEKSPIVSVDGKSVFYSAGPSSGLWVAQSDGSGEQELLAGTPGDTVTPVAVTKKGLLASRRMARARAMRTFVFVSFQPTLTVHEFDAAGAIHASLSDDSRLVYDAPNVEGGTSLYLLDVQSGLRSRLTIGLQHDTQPMWIGAGQLVFISDRNGRQMLWTLSLDTNAVTPLVDLGTGLVRLLGASPDGTVHYLRLQTPGQVYTTALSANGTAVTAPLKLLDSADRSAGAFNWSRDGRLAVMYSPSLSGTNASTPTVYVYGGNPLSGEGVAALTSRFPQSVHWFPDDRLGECCGPDRAPIHIVPLGLGNAASAPGPTLQGRGRFNGAAFDEGRGFYYYRGTEVFRRDSLTRRTHLIHTEPNPQGRGMGRDCLRVDPRGMWLALCSSGGVKIVPVNHAAPTLEYHTTQPLKIVGWSSDSSGVLILTRQLPPARVIVPPLGSFKTEVLAINRFTAKAAPVDVWGTLVAFAQTDVSGRRLAISSVDSFVSPELWSVRTR